MCSNFCLWDCQAFTCPKTRDHSLVHGQAYIVLGHVLGIGHRSNLPSPDGYETAKTGRKCLVKNEVWSSSDFEASSCDFARKLFAHPGEYCLVVIYYQVALATGFKSCLDLTRPGSVLPTSKSPNPSLSNGNKQRKLMSEYCVS